MKIYEIYYPSLEISAKFKVLSAAEATTFMEKYCHLPKIEYILLTLDQCIFNLKTEVKVIMVKLSNVEADQMLISLYNGCIMLNPILDLDTWTELTQSYNTFTSKESFRGDPIPSSAMPPPALQPTVPEQFKAEPKPAKKKVNSNEKFALLEASLNSKIIGQTEAIHTISNALKRAQANLNDADRPLGVFHFTGPSGVGKTLIAKELQKFLFGDTDLVRVDCGEYQHKHENQKLIGSPTGFVGYEEGGQLTKAILAQPNTVLLLDEAEKAHPDFWNTFLKVFDDGYITDGKGNNVSFRNVIIIITSNLGNEKISDSTYAKSAGFNALVEANFKSKIPPKRALVERETQAAIRKYFRPELLNRIDETVIFNNLNSEDYLKIAELEIRYLSNKLIGMNYDIRWNEDIVVALAEKMGGSIEGARGIAKIRREEIENPLADVLLKRKHPRGTIFNITLENHNFVIT